VDAEFPEPETRFRRLSGYIEMDFVGTTPGAVAVTATSVGSRLRQAFGEAQFGPTLFLAAGQAFSLMTAQKDQLSVWPSDAELSQAVDMNYLAGTIWARTPQVRVTWRPAKRFNWAASVENPEQQIGNGLVTLPKCCTGDINAQYNTGADELRVPNLMPDLATRVAFNPIEALHIDVGGVLRAFRHTVSPYDRDFKDVGGGASINARFNPTNSTRIFVQGAFGPGLGRYVGGLAPDVAFGSDASIGAIGIKSWVTGAEQRISPTWSLGGYYSGVATENKFYLDTDRHYIGYGYPGSSNSNNRRIQEITGTGSYQFLSSPDRGSGQFSVQVSWLKREPSSPETGLASATAIMVLAQVRYNLP
jgi:hypothetical protein